MKKLLLAALFALLSPIATSQVFQYYGPAAGIQKNTGSTYQNTSAASSDVVGLFSGCSGVLLLGADGSCHSSGVPAGSTKDVQYNNSGVFAATNDFTWDPTNLILSIGNAAIGGGILTTPVTATGFGNAVLVQGGGTTVAGTAGDALIEGGSSANSSGGNAQLLGGAGQGTNGGGGALVEGGHASNGTGGGVTVTTFGGGTSGNASGQVTISTGLPSGGGNSGVISLLTGSTTSGTAGNISLATGASNGGGTSGSISITASHNAGGTDGGITLAAHGATVETIGAGVQIGAPTGGDCGVGCLNAQSLKINNVSVATNTAAGANTNVQYNSSGSFAGSGNFTFDGTGALTLGPGTSSPTSITANPRTTGAGAGNNLIVQAGTGAASGGNVGGTAELLGGTGGSTAGSTGGTSEMLGGTPGSTGSGGVITILSGPGGSTSGSSGTVNITSGTTTSGNSGAVTIGSGVSTGGTDGNISLNIGASTAVQVSGATGAVTLNAPSSGVTLTTNVIDGGAGLIVNSASSSIGYFQQWESAGATKGYIGLGSTMFTGGSISDFGIAAASGALRFSVNAGATTHVTIGSTGGLEVGAPTGGDKGSGTINTAGTIYTNNVGLRMASISATCTSGGCSVHTSTTANGVNTVITRASIGSYGISFSPAFNTLGGCTATILDASVAPIGNTTFIVLTSISNSGVSIGTSQNGTLTDESWSVVCNGT